MNKEISKRTNPLKISESQPTQIVPQMLAKILRNSSPQQKEKVADEAKIMDICFNNNKFKTQIVSVDAGGVLKLWDVAKGNNGKILQQFHASKTWLTSVDIEKSEGRKVATGTLDGKLQIFEINSRKNVGQTFGKDKPLVEMMGHAGAIQCIQFLSSQYIIAGSTDSLVSVWDIESPQRSLATHQQHTGDVLSLRSYPFDPNLFLSGSADLTCKIWDIRVKKPVQAEYKGHESAVNTVRFLPLDEPTNFASGSDDATINLWDLRLKDAIVTFQDNQCYDSVYQIAISPSGRYIFAATENTKLKVFDTLGNTDILNNIEFQQNSNQSDGLIKCVDISADGFALGLVQGTKSSLKDLVILM